MNLKKFKNIKSLPLKSKKCFISWNLFFRFIYFCYYWDIWFLQYQVNLLTRLSLGWVQSEARWSIKCVPGHREERKQASGPSSGWCASAAPNASASLSPAPGGAEWPTVFASPGTPAVQRNTCEHGNGLLYLNSHWTDSVQYLFLLPHDLQFLCQLDLPLSFRFLCSTTQFLSVFVPECIESGPSITNLS